MTDFDVWTTYVLSQIIVLALLLIKLYRASETDSETDEEIFISWGFWWVLISMFTYIFISFIS